MGKKGQQGGLRGPKVFVEIGSDWLKLVQAEPARDGVAISRVHLQKFGGLTEDLSGAISRALRKSGFARGKVRVCLPRQMVNMRILELPSTDPAEIADMVELQAGKQTPYSKDEIVSDYRILGGGREGYSRVMLAIVQRSVIRERFSILEDADVDVETMSVSTEGLLNWVRTWGDGADVAVLDVDSFYSEFAVVCGGRLAFTRSLLVGANELTAEYEVWREKYAREIRHSLETYRSESGGPSPSRIVLAGAGASVKGLAEALREKTGLPVEVRDCLQSVTLGAGAAAATGPDSRLVSLAGIVGMALGIEHLEFDLLPSSVSAKKALLQKARHLTAFGILLMSVLVCGSLAAFLTLRLLEDRREALQKRIQASEPGVQQVKRQEWILGLVHARQEGRLSPLAILNEVHAGTPANSLYETMDIDVEKGQVVLEGSSASRADVNLLVRNLERSPLLEGAKPLSVTQIPRSSRCKFQVVCNLESK